MKKVAGVAILGTLTIAFIAIALLAAGVGPGSPTARANHTLALGIDGNPAATPANTATSLGSTETCIDVAVTQTFTFDLFITTVGTHGGEPGLGLFSLPLAYNGSVLHITAVNVLWFLNQGGTPNVINTSDPVLPDSDGLYEVGAADISESAAHSGSGVLARVTAQGVATGSSTINIVTLDLNGDTVNDIGPFLRGDDDALTVLGDGPDAGPYFDGTASGITVAVNSPSVCDPDWDDDTVLNAADNCPNTANPGQQNMDTDTQGDACDADIDGDGFKNTRETAYASNPNSFSSVIEVCDGLDNDGDTAIDEDGVDHDNDGNHNDPGPDADADTIRDCLDATTDTDGDTVPNPSDLHDDNPMASTNDAFKDTEENWMGTDSLDACPDNSSDAAWPVDMDNNRTANVGDVIAFKPSILTSLGNANYDRRFDLNASGAVNVGDVLRFVGVILTSCTNS